MGDARGTVTGEQDWATWVALACGRYFKTSDRFCKSDGARWKREGREARPFAPGLKKTPV